MKNNKTFWKTTGFPLVTFLILNHRSNQTNHTCLFLMNKHPAKALANHLFFNKPGKASGSKQEKFHPPTSARGPAGKGAVMCICVSVAFGEARWKSRPNTRLPTMNSAGLSERELEGIRGGWRRDWKFASAHASGPTMTAAAISPMGGGHYRFTVG